MIKRSIPWTSQPQYPVQVDRSGNLFDPSKITCLINPGASRIVDAVTGKLYTVSTNPSVVPTIQGKGIKWVEASDSYIEIASDADTILDTVNCTMIVATVRTSATTTIAATYGYDGGGGPNRVLTHLPYTDNNLYWDFGNATAGAGGGRLSVGGSAYSAAGTVSIWGFVAGSRGREIWRNGIRIASDATANFTRTSTAHPFRIGAAYLSGGASGFSVAHTCSLFLISKEQWSITALSKITANPNLVYAPQQRNIYVSVAGGQVDYSLTCSAGAYTYTGQSASLSVAHSLSCAAGSYSYSGVATTLTVAHNLVCATGAYTYSGVSAALPVSRSLSCASGSYTYSGVAATLTVRHGLSCDAGSYTYAGVAATLTYIPGDGTVDYVLTCAAGAYAYSGQAATLSVNHSLTCAAGAYTYSGVSTSLQVDHRLTCDVGAYTYAGSNAILSVKRSLACATGSYDYIGNTATLDYLSGAASINYVLTCAAGAYTYGGQSATLTVVSSWAGEPFNFASPITRTFGFTSSVTKNLNFESPI